MVGKLFTVIRITDWALQPLAAVAITEKLLVVAGLTFKNGPFALVFQVYVEAPPAIKFAV